MFYYLEKYLTYHLSYLIFLQYAPHIGYQYALSRTLTYFLIKSPAIYL